MRWSFWMLATVVACSGGDDKESTDDSGSDPAGSVEAFSEAFADAACDAQIACNAEPDIIEAACDPAEASTEVDYADCDYDADYAADCLDAEWTCTSIYGVTFAEVPSVCLLALDCPPDVDTGSGDDDDDDDTVTAPYLFDDATLASGIDCSGATVTFSFDFLGDASVGMLDAADTANEFNWNDYHTLDASSFTQDGGYTLLSVELDTGVGVNEWAAGVSTLYTCDDHYDAPGVMTYTARAYDLNGGLSDCVAWGDDPSGMIDGDYFELNEPVDAGEFAGCRAVAAAR